jgi:hypothetical protein
MWNSREGSGRPHPGGEPLRSHNIDGGYVQTFTVRVVKELSDSRFALCWHDSTLCNYEEQIWAPCPAPAPGRCALSGKYVN